MLNNVYMQLAYLCTPPLYIFQEVIILQPNDKFMILLKELFSKPSVKCIKNLMCREVNKVCGEKSRRYTKLQCLPSKRKDEPKLGYKITCH